MKKSSLLTSLLLIATLTISACGSQTAEKPPTPTTAASPASPAPEASIAASPSPAAEASPEASPEAPAAAETAETYREKDGLFEISFPEGYTHQDTGSGVAFVSGDQGFGGSVDFGSAQGNQLNNTQLEEALKTEYEKRLEQVTWQGSEEQPDGSVRVDWVGTDQQGNELDAVSFVEQRGDNIFILNLFGINKAYQDYQPDAEAIVSSYRVRQ
ncbi:hypothetical protein H6G89_12160 [Oscillatoria sp. FACHB-1407]|uniref:hypothetical protein n=1 Tax=Oscillatoria sp. FACHB-1407 TaxID=2692847 RepID=UPI00168933E4|nr:hypothetical protein [Oscillatoria sp. FACHB-1407]MBD2461803.1 hypothetical protein [Oscillatoria sp. FACHB-1407]